MNKVILIGRLTADIQLRQTPAGHATANFTIAIDRTMKNTSGTYETDFIPVSIPPYKAKLAELCAEYLKKGKLVSIEGCIQIRSYVDKAGFKHWVSEVIAESVEFLSPKGKPTVAQDVNSTVPQCHGHTNLW